MNQEQAQERINELKGYYAHLVSYIAVNPFLMVVNLATYHQYPAVWFFYPLLGWGIGLVIHTVRVFGTGSDWEERKMQELTGWSLTQHELERLADRTDNLIAILSDVNWEKIDPELIGARENLLNARETIVEMRDHGSVASGHADKDEVIREIERLEEFVTSAKFKFISEV